MFVGNMLIAKGVVSSADAGVLTTAIVTGLGAIVTAWPIIWGIVAHSKAAMIQSVNSADNGVKVVAATATAVTVTAPLK